MVKNLLIIILLFNYASSQRWVTKTSNNYSDAIVSIYANNNSFGSGFNIDKNGLVVTNYHVVAGATDIMVEFTNRGKYRVNYYSYVDKNKDFVLLKISGNKLPTVRMGKSKKVNVGHEVLAIGNPKGMKLSVTKGIISQIRPYTPSGINFFQTDTYIGPGSSGGPLFNKSQYVIGVTTSGFDNSSINFAIPIDYIKKAKEISNNATKKKVGFDVKVASSLGQKQVSNGEGLTDEDVKGILSSCILYLGYLLILGLLPAA